MEIYHHGIKGQKWGKRNGPPYPIAPEDHSAAEKKAKWYYSLDRNTNDKSVLKKVSDNTTRAGKLAFRKTKRSAATLIKPRRKQQVRCKKGYYHLSKKQVLCRRMEYIVATFECTAYLPLDRLAIRVFDYRRAK